MPFLSPKQQCQSTEGKNTTSHGLAYPKLTWGLPTLSLTTNSSWLPWGGLPLISPLMPVPHILFLFIYLYTFIYLFLCFYVFIYLFLFLYLYLYLFLFIFIFTFFNLYLYLYFYLFLLMYLFLFI